MGSLFGFQGVTAEEIADLALMARRIYDDVPLDVPPPPNTPKWENITGSLGLDPTFLGPGAASYIPPRELLDIDIPGDPGEAVVYRNNDTNTIAISFQGTGDLGDVLNSYVTALDIEPILLSTAQLLYLPLITALASYGLANPFDRVLLTGQSIGGTLAQEVKKGFFQEGPELSVRVVTFANPDLDASTNPLQPDILHIGIEGDPVYRITRLIGGEEAGALKTTGLQVVYSEELVESLSGWPFLEIHDPLIQAETGAVLGNSILANNEAQNTFVNTLPPLDLDLVSILPEMSLDSEILVVLDDQGISASTGNPSDPPLFILAGDDYEAFIFLDGNGDSIFEGGQKNDVLVADPEGSGSNVWIGKGGNDQLIGGDLQDILIGGEGSDILEGNVGNDFLIGGKGNDTINGGVSASASPDPDLLSPDSVYYTGSPDEYDLLSLGGEPGLLPSIRVHDKIPNRDGTDILSNVEFLIFGSGVKLQVFPNPSSHESMFAGSRPVLQSPIAAFSPDNSGITSALIPT